MRPVRYAKQVLAELKRVKWLTPKETATTTLIVFVAVLISSTFFLLADSLIYKCVSLFLNLEG